MRLVRMPDTRKTDGGAIMTLCRCGQVLCRQVLRFNGRDLAFFLEEGRTCASRSGTRLGRFHAKPLRPGSESSWHQRLGDLFTGIAAGEEALGEGD
jgi:hypothetical protein